MNARQQLIEIARQQRDAQLAELEAAAKALRALDGYALLRTLTLTFSAGEPETSGSHGSEPTPGFVRAATAACVVLDGCPDPRDVERVSFRPTEQQPERVFIMVAWRRGGGRPSATEARVHLEELELAWTASDTGGEWPPR